jgi:hypothetical protein
VAHDGPSGHAFLLGAAKAASSALAVKLGRHPDILLSAPKEPFFFEYEYDRGLDFYEQKYFPLWDGERWKLDGRPLHLFLPFTATRIAQTYPDAPLVAILRNPTERAFSQWLHRAQRWGDCMHVGTLDEEIAADLAAIEAGVGYHGPDGDRKWLADAAIGSDFLRHRAPLLLQLGHYAEQLEHYLSLFPAEQLFVLFTEELDDPQTMTGLLSFLGVPVRSLETPRENTRLITHRPGPLGFVTKSVQRFGIQRALPRPLRSRLKRAFEVPNVLPDASRKALDDYFAPHNQRLSELLDRPLPPGWSLPAAGSTGQPEPQRGAEGGGRGQVRNG